MTSENENFSLYDIIDQESFIEKNSEIIINELKDNLPKEIISKIEEEEDLISFSKNYLYLIEKLDALSQKLKLYIEIIDSNSGNEFYNEWGTVSSKNTKVHYPYIMIRYLQKIEFLPTKALLRYL